MKFRITYEITTDESATHGDAQWRGFLPKTETVPRRNHSPKTPALFSLRDAVRLLRENDGGQQPLEGDSCPWSPSHPLRWVTSVGYYDGGECTSLSLHFGEVTGATACRISRLLSAYGERCNP